VECFLRACKSGSCGTEFLDATRSGLKAASQRGHVKVVRALLASEDSSRRGETFSGENLQEALFSAVMTLALGCARAILRHRAIVAAARFLNEETMLHVAARGSPFPQWESPPRGDHGARRIAEIMLACGAVDIGALRRWDTAALQSAVRGVTCDMVAELLAAPGMDVNAQCDLGLTALHVACVHGYMTVVKLLLAVPGVNVGAKNFHGRTALHFAAALGLRCPVTAAYESYRSEVSDDSNDNEDEEDDEDDEADAGDNEEDAGDEKNGDQEEKGDDKGDAYASVVSALLGAGIEVGAIDKDGCTALHYVVSVKTAKLLLAAGADVNAADNKGRTPFRAAEETGRSRVAAFLKTLKAPTHVDLPGC